MELSKISKGLFALKKQEENSKDNTESITNPNIETRITYQDYGFQQAGRLGGTIPGLHACLHKIYYDFKKEIKNDLEKQDKLKQPMRVKIEEYKGDNERLSNKIEKIKNENIPTLKRKTENLKEELSNIKKNPHEITGDDAGKAGFVIGGIILLFLTVYLFIFYSSASYSTFFKEFSLNEIGVANSIFDPNAISKAFQDGVTELILILTIPFVFLGLGYLIHKFGEEKGGAKFVKTGMLILITFAFDAILAYEITKKIYDIKAANSFESLPDYVPSMAFNDVNFWLIIFAGFLVYLIWGFVFGFVMEAYAKMDKVKVALQEKEKQIKETESEIHDLETQTETMTQTIDTNITEINKLSTILEGSIIPREFEQDIFSFSTGWLAWMKHSGQYSKDEMGDIHGFTLDFVKMTFNVDNSLESVN